MKRPAPVSVSDFARRRPTVRVVGDVPAVVDREFDSLGVEDVVIGLLPGNEGALRLYERNGFRPNWLYLGRFRSEGR